MSDQTQVLPQKAAQSGSLRQRIFNIVGWLAFLLLAPPALQMLGLPALQDFLSAKAGSWGSPIALAIYFYAILFLRVFFGSDQRYTPVLLGYAISFIYFSNSLDIGFMQWLRDLSAQVGFLAYPYMSFIAGIVVIFLSNALSGAKKARWPVDLIVLGLLPAAGLVCAGIFLPGLLGF
jgi:hypothetical protein